MNEIRQEDGFKVMSPWAEADPVPARGISDRIDSLRGKTIGLFCNSKRAARLILESVEKWMAERYPETVVSWYISSIPNVPEMESKNSGKFEKWLGSVDGVILAVGD